jgi:hypothetical protein
MPFSLDRLTAKADNHLFISGIIDAKEKTALQTIDQ